MEAASALDHAGSALFGPAGSAEILSCTFSTGRHTQLDDRSRLQCSLSAGECPVIIFFRWSHRCSLSVVHSAVWRQCASLGGVSSRAKLGSLRGCQPAGSCRQSWLTATLRSPLAQSSRSVPWSGWVRHVCCDTAIRRWERARSGEADPNPLPGGPCSSVLGCGDQVVRPSRFALQIPQAVLQDDWAA